MTQRVLVVGAGVIGLSCAVRLAEAGFDTHVLARDLPLETTSAVAAALWMPYRAQPLDQVLRWARRTHEALMDIHDTAPGAGMLVRDGVLVDAGSAGAAVPRPAWADGVGDLAPLSPVRNPAPGCFHGWAARLPVVEIPVYLPWLVSRLTRAGGTITRMPLPALPPRGVVVNATGVAARALAGDDGVRPVRGQVIVLDNPGLTDWLVDDHEVGGEITYVVPRRSDVVVGGTATEDSWDTAPDPGQTARMLDRACRLVPALKGARVRSNRVGLRPGRDTVRCETQRRDDGAVVHCYGHGGSGVTLSWGCADDVLGHVQALT